ncbi:MAG: M4 family metallopeptidase, partial [Candidatus Roizmanbacteria bacterium]
IISQDSPIFFHKKYFVDLSTGNIIYQESLIRDVLQRIIYNCVGETMTGGVINCPYARGEGSVPVGDSDVDNSYNYLGETYQYYLSAFNRDSYDSQGGVLKTLVHFSSADQQIKCPNVFWVGDPNYFIVACDGMIAKDVYAHEFTHGVVEKTAQLILPNQSGALNEGLADVFAYGLDNNWTLGEDTTLGIIRYMNDPTQTPANFGGPQPDRLFSPYYYCGEQDSGGVHRNNGVINKTFYLMVDGGSFNGCTITGIGKDKSLAIMYRTLTTYLTPTANFKLFYTAALQACNDLYQNEPNTCNQIKSAFESTEMDQQLDSGQKSPICSGVVKQTPACALASTPTTNPNCSCLSDSCSSSCIFDIYSDVNYPSSIKCSLSSSLFPSTPTSSDKNSWCQAAKKTKGDADGNGVIDMTDYFYYVGAFNGGKIPTTVNPDFNGDGKILPTDREIIIRSL